MNDTEVRSLLHHAAATPRGEIELPTVERRGRQLRRSRLVTTGSAVVAVVIGLAVGTALVMDAGRDPTVQTPATPTESKPYVDERNGMSVRIPAGWRRTVPPPKTGTQRLTVHTAAQTTRCDGSRTPSAQIAVMEIPTDLTVTPTPAPRPAAFGPTSGQSQDGTTGENGCFATTGLAPGQAIIFTDKDRVFRVFITLYPGAGAERRRAQAYGILDSLRFRPSDRLRRPPLALPGPGGQTADLPRVLVLNGSGTPTVAASTANNLRGRGYPIAGTGNAPVRSGNLVQCSAGFEDEASELAAVLVPKATVGAYPEPSPPGAENADCIVTMGS